MHTRYCTVLLPDDMMRIDTVLSVDQLSTVQTYTTHSYLVQLVATSSYL